MKGLAAIFRPYPLKGTVDTTVTPIVVTTETEFIVKSILIQNTHAANDLKVYFQGQGEAAITLFPKTNITLSVEGEDRIAVRKIYLQGSAATTTWEILVLIGRSAGRERSDPP